MKNKLPFIIVFSALFLMSGTIDLENLYNYSDQEIPEYINKDNTNTNAITDAGATLGRVLFYDKQLSKDYTISCASCHQQEHGFSDPELTSLGVNGLTARHSMRLINTRFAGSEEVFWDKRAATLEAQTIQPIEDHIEMGFSGMNGDPSFEDLISRLDTLKYYNELFFLAFGDTQKSKSRIGNALAQFIRSIQSFDSKYDEGVTLTDGKLNVDFPNFTDEENKGKMLFMSNGQFEVPAVGQPISGNRIGGGLGCNACHRAPEFDINPVSQNNNVISSATDPLEVELNIVRAPSLRNIFSPSGEVHGPMMHNALMTDFELVMMHYNNIDFDPSINPNMDLRLAGSPQGQGAPGTGPGQKLNMTEEERNALTAFMKTLTGVDVYMNEKWANPFDENGGIEILNGTLYNASLENETKPVVYPNPTSDRIIVASSYYNMISIRDLKAQVVYQSQLIEGINDISMSNLSTGIYMVELRSRDGRVWNTRVVKQ